MTKWDRQAKIGFVMTKDIAVDGVPAPTSEGVDVRKRAGGRFAVLRFSGQVTTQPAKESETKLRSWMAIKGLVADDSLESSCVEFAGYDPPFTPGPLRRNEVLIHLR